MLFVILWKHKQLASCVFVFVRLHFYKKTKKTPMRTFFPTNLYAESHDRCDVIIHASYMHRRLKNWTHPSPTATAASVPQYPDGYGNKPVTYVSLAEARLYCTAVGKRLVHEWEWQLAAQGLDGRLYPWGRLLIECRASPFIHTHTHTRASARITYTGANQVPEPNCNLF